MDESPSRRILTFLTCAPNGIQAMSADIPGLVQTSLNLGILTTEEGMVNASFCVRSSVDSQKQMLVERLACLTKTLGGSVAVFGDYSGWEYRPDSPLRELPQDADESDKQKFNLAGLLRAKQNGGADDAE